MKDKYTTLLAVAFGLASVMTLKATSGYDLILGFTQGGSNSSGNDFLLDIGPVPPGYVGSTPIFDGEQWDLNAALTGQNFNLQTVEWGIAGDAVYRDGVSNQTLWVTTSAATPPPAITNDTSFADVDYGITSIEENVFGGLSDEGQSNTVSAGLQYSWNTETVSGTLGTEFVNAYQNPNVAGTNGVAVLWQVPVAGTPSELGTFTLTPAGLLTFTTFKHNPPQPYITQIQRVGNTSTIYFTTAKSFKYTLYYTNGQGLLAPINTWSISPTTIKGNDSVQSLQDTTSTSNRVYLIGVN